MHPESKINYMQYLMRKFQKHLVMAAVTTIVLFIIAWCMPQVQCAFISLPHGMGFHIVVNNFMLEIGLW